MNTADVTVLGIRWASGDNPLIRIEDRDVVDMERRATPRLRCPSPERAGATA